MQLARGVNVSFLGENEAEKIPKNPEINRKKHFKHKTCDVKWHLNV